jgi:WhiB family redox-sensing transcriptional regulator
VTQGMRPSNATIASALELWRAGVSKADIARRVGFSDSAVGRWIRGPQPQPEDEPVELARNWREQALCAQVDPELFFPDHDIIPKEAKLICDQCRVRLDCLQYALDNHPLPGVWAGTNHKKRKELRRRTG